MKKILGITYISFSLIFEQIANKNITKMLSAPNFSNCCQGLGFLVTNSRLPAGKVVKVYNGRDWLIKRLIKVGRLVDKFM